MTNTILRLPDEITYAGFLIKREEDVNGKWKIIHLETNIEVCFEHFNKYIDAKGYVDQLIGRD